MIRGALLLTVGFGLGYVKALHDVPAIEEGLITVIGLLKDEAKVRAERADNINNIDDTPQGET